MTATGLLLRSCSGSAGIAQVDIPVFATGSHMNQETLLTALLANVGRGWVRVKPTLKTDLMPLNDNVFYRTLPWPS